MSHFDVALAHLDLERRVCERGGEREVDLLRLHLAEIWVDLVELPHEGRPLGLDRRAVGARRVRLEHLRPMQMAW